MDLTEGLYAAWKLRKIGLREIHEYGVWRGMLCRCNNPNDPSYRNYGERGIKVCSRWQDHGVDSFWLFIHDVGLWPGAGYTIDRINNDGPYCPENVSWATKSQQNSNRRFPKGPEVGEHCGGLRT